ncbi:MAG: toll/interleukin-1 receptor domain-containing protein [Acidobacteriota bacterium]
MIGHIDLHPFLPVSWSKEYGDRSFQFDAFISHNRGDEHSKRLAQELGARGVMVWHDDDQDLRDRRVQEVVSSALIRSRFVVLSVDDRFRDSVWCRAEYLPAIEVERQASASRVMVAHMVPHSVVPDSLSDTPYFECYHQDELDRLSVEVRNGNRLPFNTDWSTGHQLRAPKADDAKSACEAVIKDKEGREDINSRTLRWVAYSVEDGDNLSHPQQLMAARQMLIENAKLSAFSEREFAFLVSSALFFCGLSDSDKRANGMYMLLHLAENEPTGYVCDELFHIVGEEPDASILSLGYPWFERRWGSLNAKQRSIVELCALRDPIHLRLYYPHSQMVRAFSEVTRAKVFARGLETEILPYKERMHLLEERADYILASAKVVTGASGIDRLRGVMGIGDLEVMFREIDALLFDRIDGPRRESGAIAPRVVALIDRIANHSKNHEGLPLIAMEEWVLDYVLRPLLWCTTLRITRKSARRTFSAVCNVLEATGSLSHEVPFYREYLKITLAGADIGHGLSSECFRDVGLRMMKASDEHRRQEAFQALLERGLVEIQSNEGMDSDEK